MAPHVPSVQELRAAREAFEANVPRDLFYRSATNLVELARRGAASLTVTEAVGVLLQTWNRTFYQYRRFDQQHFAALDDLLSRHAQDLAEFSEQSIEALSEQDRSIIDRTFAEFETVLGPVGAAKCLHLLAPHFFPLWDRAIADAYGLPLKKSGRNADGYLRFMQITRQQVAALGAEAATSRNPLKALDEYNYCRYTKGWL